VTAYLLEPQILAVRGNQRRLLLIGFHRLMMVSSIKALAASLDDEDFEVEFTTEDAAAPDPEQVEAELARVRDFVTRVGHAAARVIGERRPDRRVDLAQIGT
jgi:hypothetical protein